MRELMLLALPPICKLSSLFSASAQVAIDMQNKKLQSGVLKSNTKKAGFLFIQDDNNYISKNAVNATIETNLLMVPDKKPIVLKSKLETYN